MAAIRGMKNLPRNPHWVSVRSHGNNRGAVNHVTRLYEDDSIDAINLAAHVAFLVELVLNNDARSLNINEAFR